MYSLWWQLYELNGQQWAIFMYVGVSIFLYVIWSNNAMPSGLASVIVSLFKTV